MKYHEILPHFVSKYCLHCTHSITLCLPYHSLLTPGRTIPSTYMPPQYFLYIKMRITIKRSGTWLTRFQNKKNEYISNCALFVLFLFTQSIPYAYLEKRPGVRQNSFCLIVFRTNIGNESKYPVNKILCNIVHQQIISVWNFEQHALLRIWGKIRAACVISIERNLRKNHNTFLCFLNKFSMAKVKTL